MKNRFLIFVIVLLSSMSVFGDNNSGNGVPMHVSIVCFSISGERVLQHSFPIVKQNNLTDTVELTHIPMIEEKLKEIYREYLNGGVPYVICIVVEGRIVKSYKILQKKMKQNKNTIVVNLYGGPGCGKSTGAAYIFSKLKMMGIDTEYVSEFAKDKTWENNSEVFNNQLYISGKQSFKLSRCIGKVDVIVTDCPLLLGIIYNNIQREDDLKGLGDYINGLNEALLSVYAKYNNINIVLKRTKPYNSNGRSQTEEESKTIGAVIRGMLGDNKIPYIEENGDEDGYNRIVSVIANMLKEKS